MLSSVFIILNIFTQNILTHRNVFEDTVEVCERTVDLDVMAIVQNHGFKRVLPSARFLNANCGKITKFLNCTSEKIDLFSAREKEAIKVPKNLFTEICNANSEIGKAYIETVECVNENIDGILKCMGKVWEFTGTLLKVDGLSREEKRKRNCLALYMGQEKCGLDISKKMCGERVLLFAAELLKFIQLDFVRMCSSHGMNNVMEIYMNDVRNWQWNGKE